MTLVLNFQITGGSGQWRHNPAAALGPAAAAAEGGGRDQGRGGDGAAVGARVVVSAVESEA